MYNHALAKVEEGGKIVEGVVSVKGTKVDVM
jgi:hypothetical protein